MHGDVEYDGVYPWRSAYSTKCSVEVLHVAALMAMTSVARRHSMAGDAHARLAITNARSLHTARRGVYSGMPTTRCSKEPHDLECCTSRCQCHAQRRCSATLRCAKRRVPRAAVLPAEPGVSEIDRAAFDSVRHMWNRHSRLQVYGREPCSAMVRSRWRESAPGAASWKPRRQAARWDGAGPRSGLCADQADRSELRGGVARSAQ